jgi:uncharacterized protein (DUF1501 family)
MAEKTTCGCREYQKLGRRHFLGLSAAAVATVGGPSWLPRVAYAGSENSERDVVLSLFLRGGCDGLTMVPPYGDAAYQVARPTLAIAPPDGGVDGALDLDGFFGFAPAMAPLLPAFMSGDLLPVHACGMHDGTRSHFDAMHFLEVGLARDPSLATGWLGRHLMSNAPMDPAAVLRAVGIAPGLQRTLAGSPRALPIPDPSNFRLLGSEDSAAERLAGIVRTFQGADTLLATSAGATQDTVDLLARLNFAGYTPANDATYPDSPLGQSFQAAATLIRGDVGVEAIAIDRGGWDTHQEQGPLDGEMAGLMDDLSRSLAAFHQDLISTRDRRVTVVVMSEFGRVVEENGSAGTDHGHGTAMFVLGAAVDGGRVLTDWPGLDLDQRYEGQDLAVTIDYRDVLHELLTQRLGSTDPGFALPDFQPTPQDIFLA